MYIQYFFDFRNFIPHRHFHTRFQCLHAEYELLIHVLKNLV